MTYSRFDQKFFRRMIRAFQRDGDMRNPFMQDPEARRMITELEHRKAVRLARGGGDSAE
ncbi:MAG: hypothetical protein ACQEUZ_01435 [Pseudomonadota bacterium]